jgi:hypothetical protein
MKDFTTKFRCIFQAEFFPAKPLFREHRHATDSAGHSQAQCSHIDVVSHEVTKETGVLLVDSLKPDHSELCSVRLPRKRRV